MDVMIDLRPTEGRGGQGAGCVAHPPANNGMARIASPEIREK